MSEMKKVYEFHQKFQLPLGTEDLLINPHEDSATTAANFRMAFLEEEVEEFVEAIYSDDKVKAFDALLDLVYVAMGTALLMGITPDMWSRAFQAVHDANMTKVRADHQDQSKRGSTWDVVKPAGFVSPDARIEAILNGEE